MPLPDSGWQVAWQAEPPQLTLQAPAGSDTTLSEALFVPFAEGVFEAGAAQVLAPRDGQTGR